MKTVIIHGQSHKGSTFHIARLIAEKTGGEITEFFLPKDFGEMCCGCTQCFVSGEEKCPHYKKLLPLTKAIDEADVVILASPVYVYHATGAMKSFLDHFGYRWMVHRPEESMFSKQGVCVSTAAGAGMRSAIKDMADSMRYWGTARIYRCGFAVAAIDWEGISPDKKAKIERSASAVAARIRHRSGKVKPGFKIKALFSIMRLFQKKFGYNPKDTEYWKDKGWLDKKRPWKRL